MKISELIAKLEEVEEACGDIEVSGWPYDGQASAGDGVKAWISPAYHVDEAIEFVKPKDPNATPTVFIHFE